MNISRLIKQFLFVCTFVVGLQSVAFAQSPTPYGNEWIDYNKTYYKLKVVNTGLHRLSYGFLDSLGLAGTNPQHFQLFRRGKEVAIHIAGEADGRLDTQDFIEFYGERNDGRLDQDLYKNPAHQPHQLYSLYTDTAAYFLTVNPAGGKRMQQVNPSPAGKTPEPYHLQKVTQFFAGRYYFGQKYGLTLNTNDDNGGIASQLSWMDEGEGYFDVAGSSATTTKDINIITNLVNIGPKPILEYAFGVTSTRYRSHAISLSLIQPNGNPKAIAQYSLTGDTFEKGKTVLDFSDIHTSGKITLQTKGENSNNRRIPFSFVRITFPQRTALIGNSMTYYTDSTRTNNPYFEFSGTTVSSISLDITDTYNPIRIEGHFQAGVKGFVIPTGQKSHKILLTNTNQTFKAVGKTEVIRYRNIAAADYNYIIVTNKRLMKRVAGSENAAPVEYAAYRASTVGGGYDTLVVQMEQIINQFHYGEFSSNAIRKMMAYMLTSDRPKHLFIIGKGLKYASDDYFNAHYKGKWSLYQVGARHPSVYALDLVPTGMFPSSDVFFTSDFRNERHEPKIPTGRLPITNPEEIIGYLNKVKEYEALPEGLAWRKNILQLGGGSTTTQIDLFKSWLKEYKAVAEGPFLGANVIEKYRQGVSEIIDNINVSEEVNAGLSMITFFGHSSATTSDLEIGFASQNLYGYRNKGKYPVILMNGCGTGDAFIPNFRSFGEDWLLTPDRGAISFIAHSHLGGDTPLRFYSKNYYDVAFKDENFYGKTIGEIQQEAVKRYSNSHKTGQYVATMTQMVLQSDPAIRPYAPTKPDYTLDNSTYSLKDKNGNVAISYSNPLILSVNAINYGKAIQDSIHVSIKRILPNGSVLNPYTIKVKPIYYRDQLELALPNTDTTASGMNRFEIKLDAKDQVTELNESNNVLQFQHFLPKSGISILAPNNYAIVNSSNVNLIVQSTQMRAEPKGIYFELDTTATFSSTLKRSHSAATGVIPSWNVALPIQKDTGDSTVFYWRARFESYAPGEDTVWVESSFRYIPETKGGWSQSHKGQFKESEFGGVRIEQESGNWEFDPLFANVEIRTVGGDVRYRQPPYGIFINGTVASHNACGNFEASSAPRMYFFMLDKETLERTIVPGFKGCSWIPDMYQFGDLNNPTVRANMQRFLEGIPEGNYVLAISMNRVPFEVFSPELKSAFGSIGSILIPNDKLKNGYPFAIIGRKGATTAIEATANPDDSNTLPTSQEIFIRTTLQSKLQRGSLTSTIIGPAISWGSLHHNIERYKAGNDSYKLNLYGINSNGNRELLHEDITSKTFDLSSVSADQYPNLQLTTTLTDIEDRSAPQLKQWMVYYQAAPEGVIRPDLVEVSDEIITEQASRGRITIPMAFQNVTPYAFRDSLTVEVTITGEGMEPKVSQFKIEALEGNKTAMFNYTMSTLELDGSYKLSMYVNPRLQPEQQYQNNIYEVNFAVKSRLHPIMDVAFDGIHIMDGELVSPSPLISITMKDENKHVFLQNADAMEVYLEGANIQGQFDVVRSANPNEITIRPADEKNDFRFEYKPEKLETGRYTLTVRGRDVTGKSSGKDYKINFEVENESKITNFYPYPNPFSTKTQFIFTLTGGVIPNQFKIQIMTVTGKVVKEIMREEIGPIRIGNNKTEYAWDGTDMYGDKLANGVYLYRVVMPKDTEEMKHIWKKGDKGFVNGYGKIYILR